MPKNQTENNFSDNNKISAWAKEAVKRAQMPGAMGGKNGNKFEPKSVVSRAEGATVTKRFIELVNEAVF